MSEEPTKINYYPNGIIKSKYWLGYWLGPGKFFNNYHRENDLPAILRYYKNGSLREERYYIHGYLNRNNGLPAIIEYNRSGDISLKIWILDNKYHRLDGPAIVFQHHVKWFVNGKDITEEVKKFIKDNRLPCYSKWNNDHKLLFKLRFG